MKLARCINHHYYDSDKHNSCPICQNESINFETSAMQPDYPEFEITEHKGERILQKYKGDSAVVIVPSGVTQIGLGAFAGNNEIISVSLPDSVTLIDKAGFIHCDILY